MMKRIISIFMLTLFILPLLQNPLETRGYNCQSYHVNDELNPIINIWTPPHLVPMKEVTPSSIYIKNDDGYPDVANVTLTVMAVGQPIYSYNRVNLTIAIDLSNTMENMYNGSSFLNLSKNASSEVLGKLLSQGYYSKYFSVSVLSFCQNTTNNKTEFTVDLPFTNNKTLLNKTINSLTTIGNCTPFYDGVINSYNYSVNANNPECDISIPGQIITNHSFVLVFTCGNNSCGINDLANTINVINSSKPDHNISVNIASWGPQCNISACMEICDASFGLFLHNQSVYEIVNEFTPIFSIPKPDIPVITAPSPIEPMIKEVLPPYIEYVPGSWAPGTENNETIRAFSLVQGIGGYWEMRWDVPKMKLTDCFQVIYQIRSTQLYWQSVGITSYNATNVYGSDYCRVKYQNWRYSHTGDPADIWTNETQDVSIYVMPIRIPEPPVPIITALSVVFIALFVAVLRKK